MKTTFTLYVTRYGHVRLTKNPGTTKPGEVAFSVDLDIPSSVFRDPVRTIEISVPEADTMPMTIEATATELFAPVEAETEE